MLWGFRFDKFLLKSRLVMEMFFIMFILCSSFHIVWFMREVEINENVLERERKWMDEKERKERESNRLIQSGALDLQGPKEFNHFPLALKHLLGLLSAPHFHYLFYFFFIFSFLFGGPFSPTLLLFFFSCIPIFYKLHPLPFYSFLFYFILLTICT